MRLTLAAIGKARGAVADLYAEYAKRLLWPLTLKELDLRGAPGTLQMRESEALLAALPKGAKIVVCDERGKAMTSTAFAKQMTKWQDEGAKEVAFLLGGADGHTDAMRQHADLLLSLGAMTWPHMLARVMLVEQLYRAQQILAGHPYHRE